MPKISETPLNFPPLTVNFNIIKPTSTSERKSQEVRELYEKLLPIAIDKRAYERYHDWAQDRRYPEIGLSPDTQIDFIHASALYYGQQNPYAIVGQFPRIESFKTIFKLLTGQHEKYRISCIVVAADEESLKAPFSTAYETDSFPNYFDPQWLEKNPTIFNEFSFTVTSTLNEETNEYKIYSLEVKSQDGVQTHKMPVMHIKGWKDQQVIPVEQLEKIVEKIEAFNKEANANKGATAPNAIPFIHCLAGVGRSATLAACLPLDDPGHGADVETIVLSTWADRSYYAFANPRHFELMAEFAIKHGKSLTLPSRS